LICSVQTSLLLGLLLCAVLVLQGGTDGEEEEEESKSGIGALPYLAGAAPLLKEVPVGKLVKGSLKGTGKALSGLRSAILYF